MSKSTGVAEGAAGSNPYGFSAEALQAYREWLANPPEPQYPAPPPPAPLPPVHPSGFPYHCLNTRDRERGVTR